MLKLKTTTILLQTNMTIHVIGELNNIMNEYLNYFLISNNLFISLIYLHIFDNLLVITMGRGVLHLEHLHLKHQNVLVEIQVA